VEPANDTITLIIPIASGRESSPPDAAILIFGLDVSTSVEAPEQIYRIRSNPPYSYHFDSSLSQPGVGQILQWAWWPAHLHDLSSRNNPRHQI